MRVTVGEMEVLRQEYRSFDDLVDEYIDHETEQGRRVPDYDLSVLLTAIGIYFLKKTADVLVEEVRDRRRRTREEEEARVQGELEEKRHSEMLEKINQLRHALQDAVEARPPESALNEDVTSVSALLQWAKRENVKIVVTLETEAEGDLKAALEGLTIDVPGIVVDDARLQLEGDDST
jgi:hypothetical protein